MLRIHVGMILEINVFTNVSKQQRIKLKMGWKLGVTVTFSLGPGYT